MMMGDLSQDFFYVLFLLYFIDWLLYCDLAPVGGAGDAVTSANLPLPCRWAVSSCPSVLLETAKTQLATLEGVVVLYHCVRAWAKLPWITFLETNWCSCSTALLILCQAVHYSVSIDEQVAVAVLFLDKYIVLLLLLWFSHVSLVCL